MAKLLVPNGDHSFYEAAVKLEAVIYNSKTKTYYEYAEEELKDEEELVDRLVAR